MLITASRYHDVSFGHRVVGHEGHCRYLHGHNYRIWFKVTADTTHPSLDAIGRVIDFGVIKSTLCQWLEDNWDHKTILWSDDPILNTLSSLEHENDDLTESIVVVPFNPTAENIAEYLLWVIGYEVLTSVHPEVILTEVIVEETRKCSASASKTT